MVSVQSLSGHDIDTSKLLSKYRSSGLSRVDRAGRHVHMYLDEIPTSQQCYSMKQYKSADVSNVQEAVVSAYSYYSPEKIQNAFYKMDALKTVDACIICSTCCDLGGEETGVSEGNAHHRVERAAATAHAMYSMNTGAMTQRHAYLISAMLL